jgi:hypothetical protein
MSFIVGALLGTALSAGITALKDSNSQGIAAKEDRESLIREYQESVRQQASAENLFNTTLGRTYGNDFISKMKQGMTTDQLINTIGEHTALGKQLAEYSRNANLAVQNAQRANQQQGVLASMQGRQNLNAALSLEIQAQQGAGAAQAAQATSGIRSDRGTGDNTAQIQEQQNRLARTEMYNNIAMGNKETLFNMSNTQLDAAQSADQLRRQREISGAEAIERALNAYSSHIVDMQDMDETQKNLLADAQKRNDDANTFYKNRSISDEAVEAKAKNHDYADVDYSNVEIKFEDDV